MAARSSVFSMMSTTRNSVVSAVPGLRVTVQATFEEVHEALATEAEAEAAWSMLAVFKLLALLALPVVTAVRSVAFKVVLESSGFSVITPSVVSYAELCLGYGLALLATEGLAEFKLIFTRRAWLQLLPALFGTVAAVTEQLALLYLDPAVVAALVETSLVLSVIVQFLVMRQAPSRAQLACVISSCLLTSAYTVSSQQSDGHVSIVGIMVALINALFRVLSMVVMEFVAKRSMMTEHNPSAERLRNLVTTSFWRIPINIILVFACDSQFIAEKGVLHGWNWSVFGIASLFALMMFLIFAAVMLYSTVVYQLANGLNLVVVYLLQIGFLKNKPFEVSKLLLISALMTVVATHNLIAADVRSATIAAKMDVVRNLRRTVDEAVEQKRANSVKNKEGKKEDEEAALPMRFSEVSMQSGSEHAEQVDKVTTKGEQDEGEEGDEKETLSFGEADGFDDVAFSF